MDCLSSFAPRRRATVENIVEKMESEVSRVTKLKSIDDWSIWKFQVRVLNSHGALNVAMETDVKPADLAATANEAARAARVKEVKKWNKSDAAAQKLIVTTIGHQPTLHIINCTMAAEMWLKLSSIYEQK